jgi:hypothetical protein
LFNKIPIKLCVCNKIVTTPLHLKLSKVKGLLLLENTKPAVGVAKVRKATAAFGHPTVVGEVGQGAAAKRA